MRWHTMSTARVCPTIAAWSRRRRHPSSQLLINSVPRPDPEHDWSAIPVRDDAPLDADVRAGAEGSSGGHAPTELPVAVSDALGNGLASRLTQTLVCSPNGPLAEHLPATCWLSAWRGASGPGVAPIEGEP
jgi:hypothetical protein